ncbi:MAG: hypothetical protein EPN84_02555 [Legionella sp.]|nr:MAG: hypothetical protein EPN84_02555 [Legionella sp.]
MPRDISDFHGKNVVIGCSASHRLCNHKHHPEADFFSIDRDEAENPDFVFDIRGQLPQEFRQKFNITFLENVDFAAYNEPANTAVPVPVSIGMHASISRGLRNILNMTHIDGFIVIKGCSRIREFRRSMQDLNYIELGSNQRINLPHTCIIPKNQQLTISEVNERIRANHDLMQLIERLNSTNYIPIEHQFSFCNATYESMPTLRADCLGNSFVFTLNDADKTRIAQHKNHPAVQAFYDAISALKSIKGQRVRPLDYQTYGMVMDEMINKADNFFKHDEIIIQRDLAIFQRKFALYIEQQRRSLLHQGIDACFHLTKILFALTGLGALVLSVHAKITQGQWIPTFFSINPQDKLMDDIDKALDNLSNMITSC